MRLGHRGKPPNPAWVNSPPARKLTQYLRPAPDDEQDCEKAGRVWDDAGKKCVEKQ